MSSRAKKPAAARAFDPAALYKALSSFYGPSGWWPGETPFEVMVGAVLTQNTAWTNVERAISNLRAAGLLEFRAMQRAGMRIHELIKPAGYFNIKTRRLKNLMLAISEAGGIQALFGMDTHAMREFLLAVNGIGEETADSICCYAAGRPEFVVDAYTKRMLARHGFISGSAAYGEVKAMFMDALPPDVQIFKDLHAWIVFVGKDFCRKRDPDCGGCPVSRLWAVTDRTGSY